MLSFSQKLNPIFSHHKITAGFISKQQKMELQSVIQGYQKQYLKLGK